MTDNDTLIERLKAIAHPTRFAILQALSAHELNVGEIEQRTATAQPGLSQQLAILRQAALVTTRREAKLVYYAVDRDCLDGLLSELAKLRPSQPAEADTAPRHESGAARFARLLQQ